jgi:hypothetical protein
MLTYLLFSLYKEIGITYEYNFYVSKFTFLAIVSGDIFGSWQDTGAN